MSAEIIRELNDRFRTMATGGYAYLTAGGETLPLAV